MRLVASLLLTLTTTCYAFAANNNAKLELKYFDLRGAAETARILLAFGNEEFVDTRFEIAPGTFDSPPFNKAKESGELGMNLNRVPVLVTPDGATIGQSKAIERFLARQMGLMGKTPTEEAFVDCVAEHCRDVKDAQMRKGFSAFTKNKTDEEKETAREEWFGTDMPQMLEKINEAVKSTGTTEGCAVGSAPSFADVAIFCLLRDCMPSDKYHVTNAAKNCDVLNTIADSVAANTGVAKWLSERPETMF
jgi:glutathione S-transferase